MTETGAVPIRRRETPKLYEGADPVPHRVEHPDDAIHVSAPWEPRVSLCGQWSVRNMIPIGVESPGGNGSECWSCWDAARWITDHTNERDRYRAALEHLAKPNHAIKATGGDAIEMSRYARRALDNDTAETETVGTSYSERYKALIEKPDTHEEAP